MPYVDRPLPEALVLPMLREPKPHDKRLDNLIHEGRAKGLANKITRDLRNGVIDAAINVGRDGLGTDGLAGFLEDLAAHHKKLFTSLLVRVLPMQLNTDITTHTPAAISIVSIPTGAYFKPEALAEMEASQTIQADVVNDPQRYLDFSGEQLESAPEVFPKELIASESGTMTPSEMQLLTELSDSISSLARQVGVSLGE